MSLTIAPVAVLSNSPFHALEFAEHQQYVLRCAAGFECDIQLESGERVNDGFNAHIDDWDPHIGYSGDGNVTPHLVLRPSIAGLRTNIILTTTKRTYYLLAISTSTREPSYYSFVYPSETFRVLRGISYASQAAARASGDVPVPIPTSTPANVARLGSTCVDYDYSYTVDRNVQSDHPPHARPSKEALPKNLIPRLVCTDGQHTFIEFPRQQEVPADLPISLAVTAEGDTLIDYTYVASLNRFTIDGVYDSFALEIGSQDQPLRLRIYHAGRGNPPENPPPVRIIPPADLNIIDHPVVPIQTPLIINEVEPSLPQPTAAPSAQQIMPIMSPTAPPTSIPTVSPAMIVPTTMPTSTSNSNLMMLPSHEKVIVSLKVSPRPVDRSRPIIWLSAVSDRVSGLDASQVVEDVTVGSDHPGAPKPSMVGFKTKTPIVVSVSVSDDLGVKK